MRDRSNTDRTREDARLAIPLDPEEALRALLKVDPDAEPVEDDEDEEAPP